MRQGLPSAGQRLPSEFFCLCPIRRVCDLPSGDVDAIPGVDRRDRGNQRGERPLVVVLASLVPDFIRDRIRPVAEAGGGFGQRLPKTPSGPSNSFWELM
jgi:hypothetical protein